MWPFKNRSSKVTINTDTTESSDPVVSDVIDLRKVKGKAKRPSEDKDFFEKIQSSKKSQTKEDLKVVTHYNKKPKKPLSRNTKRLIAGGVFLVIIVILLNTVLASAKILIQPKKENFSLARAIVTVDPNLSLPDLDTHRIPGQEIQELEDISVSVPASGKQFVQTRAKGIITISNSYSSSPQSLVQRTRFQEKTSGKIYRLTRNIIVPGAKIENGKIVASIIDAEVEADGIGESYNINSGEFSIPGFQGTPKFAGFSARIKTSLTGGYQGTSQVVSKEDLTKANAEFEKMAREKIQSASSRNLPPGFIMVQSAEKYDITGKKSSVVGEPGANATISGKARMTNIAFEKKTLLEYFNAITNGDQARKKKVSIDDANITFDSGNQKDGKLLLTVSGTIPTVYSVNIDTIVEKLAGKKEAEASTVLRETEGISAFGVKIFPFWLHTFPSSSAKISVEILEK